MDLVRRARFSSPRFSLSLVPLGTSNIENRGACGARRSRAGRASTHERGGSLAGARTGPRDERCARAHAAPISKIWCRRVRGGVGGENERGGGHFDHAAIFFFRAPFGVFSVPRPHPHHPTRAPRVWGHNSPSRPHTIPTIPKIDVNGTGARRRQHRCH